MLGVGFGLARLTGGIDPEGRRLVLRALALVQDLDGPGIEELDLMVSDLSSSPPTAGPAERPASAGGSCPSA